LYARTYCKNGVRPEGPLDPVSKVVYRIIMDLSLKGRVLQTPGGKCRKDNLLVRKAADVN